MAATKKGEQPASEAEQATDRRGRRRGSGSRRRMSRSSPNLVDEETISQSVTVESNSVACDDETVSKSCPEPTQDLLGLF